LQFIEFDVNSNNRFNFENWKNKGISEYEWGWIGIDNAHMLNEIAFNILRTRLWFELPNGNKPEYKIRLTSDTSLCWLTPNFIESKDPNYAFIESIVPTYGENDDKYQEILGNNRILQTYLHILPNQI